MLNFESGNEVGVFRTDYQPVQIETLPRDGGLIIAGDDSQVHLLGMDGTERRTFGRSFRSIVNFTLSGDGSRLLVRDFQGAVELHATHGSGILSQIDAASDAVLCMIDEIDGREKETWVYDAIYKSLDLNKSTARKPTVFVLIGSGDGHMEHLLARITPRLKGTDLLDRIPDSVDFRVSLPTQVLGDKLIGFLSGIVTINSEIKRVEKFALYYMLGTYGKKSPRQIAGLAERSARCVGHGETVLRFDHVTSAGSGAKEDFSKIHHTVQQNLARHLLTLT